MAYHFGVFPAASLARELADRDARLLLDIGLVRAEDGSLHLAEDPSQPLKAASLPRTERGIIARLLGWVALRPVGSRSAC
ncbi:MAG TPA: hypothetical protein VGM59_16490 [Dongiaceae bacterium]